MTDASAAEEREVSRIIANLTHELKTPLHSILAVSGLLLSEADGTLNIEQRRQVEVMQRSASQLHELIINLLNFSSAESRNVLVQRFDLGLVIDDVLDGIRPLADKNGIALKAEYEPKTLICCADRALVRLILANLVGNAVKFSPSGSVVTVYAQMLRDQGIELQVADSGIGIGADQQSRVFEEFYQAESSDSRRYGGVGLGLALVQMAVRRLGGSVRVASEPGQGSLFTVQIPSLERLLPVHRILVIEPDSGVRLSLLEVFRAAGHAVEALIGDVDEELEVLKAATQTAAQLVIMNVRRPVEKGVELIRALKQGPAGAERAVLAMSSLGAPAERSLVFAAGADDFIVKPFDLPELIVRAEKLLQEKGGGASRG